MARNQNNSSFYTEEIQNGIRVSMILVNVASKIVREILDHAIKNSNNRFSRFLKYPSVKYTSLTDFLFKCKAKIDSLNFFHQQIETLYPKKKPATSMDKFDLTLCIRLLRLLIKPPKNGWQKKPDSIDPPIIANIGYITILRNENYAHVNEIGCDKNELQRLDKMGKKNFDDYSLVAKAEHVLFGFINFLYDNNSTKVEECKIQIGKYLTDNISQNDCDRYKDLIANLVVIDKDTVQMFRDYVRVSYNMKDEIIQKLGQIENEEKKVDVKIDDLKRNQTSLLNILKKNLGESFHLFKAMSELSNDISSMKSTIEITHEKVDLILEGIETVKLLNKDTSEKRVQSQTIALEDFKEYLKEKENYFRILILDAHDCNYSIVDKDNLIDSIAKNEWNVILEILTDDQENGTIFSLKSSICEKIAKSFVIEKPSTLKDIKDWNCIFNKEQILYVSVPAANLENNESESDSNLDDLEEIRMHIFEKFPRKVLVYQTIVCVNYLLRKNYQRENLELINKLNEKLKEGVYRAAISNNKVEPKTLEFIYLLSTDLENIKDSSEEINRILKSRLSKSKKYLCSSASNQIITAMLKCSTNMINNEIFIQGDKGQIIWTKQNIKNYDAYFEVYHCNIGKIESNEQMNIEDKRREFFQGKGIDPETIYIHHDLQPIAYPTYVRTSIFDRYLNKIKEDSGKEEFFKNNELIREIRHKPSWGGTTIGRVLLYNLSKTLPCVRLKYVDKEGLLFEGLDTILLQTNLPIVILIDSDSKFYGEDSPDITKVQEFSNKLATKSRKHFIIYPHHSFQKSDIPNYTANEIEAYKNLYQSFINKTQDIDSKNKMYCNLINLRLMLLKNNFQLDNTIKETCASYLEQFSETERNLLLIMYFFNKYAGEYVDVEIASFILKEEKLLEKFEKFLQDPDPKGVPTFFFLIILNITKGFKLIDTRLGETFIETLNLQDFNPIANFYSILIHEFNEAIKKDNNESLLNMLIEYSHSLFVHNNQQSNKLNFGNKLDDIYPNTNKHKHQKKEIEFYCQFIYESIKDNGKMLTLPMNLEKLTEIYKTIDEITVIKKSSLIPQLIILSAKFLFHEANKKEKAIEYLKDAFKIKKSLEKEYKKVEESRKTIDLLKSYADLFRHYMVDKNKTGGKIQEIYEFAKESVFAYTKALELNKNDVLALYGECKLRSNIIYIYNKRKNEILNRSEFFILFSESIPVIIKRMDNLKTLLNRGFDDYYDINYELLYQQCVIETTKIAVDNLLEIETSLSKLNRDYKIDMFEIIKATRRKIDFNPNRQNKNFDWNDLSKEEIESIIKQTELQLTIEENYNTRNNTSNDFRNLLLAFIYGNIKGYIDTNISYVLNRVIQWHDKFPDEPDCNYYLGIIKLIQCIDENNMSYLREANDYFKNCKEYYLNISPSAPKKFRKIEFLIGKETGLKRLILFSDEQPLEQLYQFEEELKDVNKNESGTRIFPVFKLKSVIDLICLKRSAFSSTDNIKIAEKRQQNKFKFYISISREGLNMFKYKRI